MNTQNNLLTIAIDGPSGAGKSTIAKALSKRLGIVYLDTGAMYRGLAVWLLRRGVDVKDEAAVVPFLSSLDMKISYSVDGTQLVSVNGEDVTAELRKNHVSRAASDVSALLPVRRKLVELQQRIAAGTSVVLDGRDIGTVVLPNATNKFYITAAVGERAKRRRDELFASGTVVDLETIESEIAARDLNDSTRANSPLRKADDAVEIDTTDMTPDEVIATVLGYIGD